MKVLEVGSGAGDVTLLLAELVGPTGSLVGVDVYLTVLEVARARVRAVRLNNIIFIAEDIRKISLDNHFDAVVGRNVLMYVADPAEVLRICADHLQPGGVMAFQEVEWSITERVDSMPSVAPLVQQAATWMIGGFRKARAERKRIENGSVCVTVPRYQCWRSP